MSEYKLKKGKIGEKIVDTYKDIEEKFTGKFLEEDKENSTGQSMKNGKTGKAVTDAYQKIEDTVVGGYKKIEDTVVGGYKKIESAFVDTFLEKNEDDK